MAISQGGEALASSRKTASRRRRKPGIALGIAALSASLITASAVSAAASAKAHAAPAIKRQAAAVKPDFAYYKGKTILMIYWGSTGGVGDISSRVLAPYIAAYLHCQVNVTD